MSKLSFELSKFSQDNAQTDEAYSNTPSLGGNVLPATFSRSSVDADPFARQKESKKEKKSRKQFMSEHDYDELDMLSMEIDNDMRRIDIDYDMFDTATEHLFEINNDDELKRSLIAQGRKYDQAHHNSEMSEYEKVFAPQETALRDLINDVNRDIVDISKDINNMRLARVKSPKALSDIITAKASLHNIKLSALKEIDKVKKDMCDLSIKTKKDESADSQASIAANLALQQLLNGDARDSLSDAYSDDMLGSHKKSSLDEPIDLASPDEAEAEREYLQNTSEGDLYIKYENSGADMYVQLDNEDNVKGILARDRDGNMIPDFPLPSVDYKDFTLNTDLGTASDAFHRNYRIERV